MNDFSDSAPPSSPPEPSGKLRGLVGTVVKPDALGAAVFVPQGDVREEGQARETVAVPGLPVGGRPSVAAALDALRLKELEDARMKLTSGMKLTAQERRMLDKEEQERKAQEGREAGQHAGAELWDVARVVESINAYWVNGEGGNFQMRDRGEDWLLVPEAKLELALMRRGVPDYTVDGEPISRLSQAVMHTMEHRMLHAAVEALAGYEAGVHEVKEGNRLLVRRGPKLLKPVQGEWPVIQAFIEGMLAFEPETETPALEKGRMIQIQVFHWWMARAVENFYCSPGMRLNSQILIMAGPHGCGKSRLQHMVITPLVGGRSADPSRYLFGGTEFNGDWMGKEHLLVEDPRPSMKMLDRLQFAQILKGLAVNEDLSFHKKSKDAFGVSPEFLVSITINDDPDSLRILPPLTPDFEDKVMLLHVTKRPLPMPTRTAQERLAFQKAVRDELPAYLWFLLNDCPVPTEWQSERFGVRHYHEPNLRLHLWEDSPPAELLALIDCAQVEVDRIGGVGNYRSLFVSSRSMTGEELLEKYPMRKMGPALRLVQDCVNRGRRVWIGGMQDLQNDLENSQHGTVAKKLLGNNAPNRLLARLAEDRPERVVEYRVASVRCWLIAAPDDMALGEVGF